MYRAYKYKLSPTEDQSQLFSQWEGSTRWLWNQFLSATTQQYAIDKKFIWEFDLKKRIPELKKEHDWLKQVPAHALQNVATNLGQALKRATKKKRSGIS